MDGERHSPLPALAEGIREAVAARVREDFPICCAFAAAIKALAEAVRQDARFGTTARIRRRIAEERARED